MGFTMSDETEELEEEDEPSLLIPLGRDNLYAMLSYYDEDLLQLEWYAHRGKGDYYYAAHRFSIGGGLREREWLHTVVMERMIGRKLREGELADHSNLDKLDNRRSNLRLASRAENEANKRKRVTGGTSKYKGVSYMKTRNRWRATIQIDHKQRYLGTYIDEDDAGRAYNKAALEIFGEFSLLNEIPEKETE